MAKKTDYTIPFLGAGALVAAYFFLLRKKSDVAYSGGGMRDRRAARAERQASAGSDDSEGVHAGSNAS